MNCFMHIIPLALATVLFGILAAVFGVVFFNDTDRFDQRRPRWIVWSGLFLLLFSGSLGWWIASGQEKWTTEVDTFHEVKEVTWPDGTKVQMFTVDGIHHNLTAMFGKMVDDSWVVRRIRWNPVYLGVSWSSCERCQLGDRYYLEQKTGTQQIELIVEKNDQQPK